MNKYDLRIGVLDSLDEDDHYLQVKEGVELKKTVLDEIHQMPYSKHLGY